MGTNDYCRPGDSTSMSLPFHALHKGTLIIFSISLSPQFKKSALSLLLSIELTTILNATILNV